MDVQLSFGNVGNVVIFQVEDSLRVFNDGTGIRGDKVFNGLGEAIFR